MFDVADAKGLYGRWFVYASRASEELGNESLVGFADLRWNIGCNRRWSRGAFDSRKVNVMVLIYVHPISVSLYKDGRMCV